MGFGIGSGFLNFSSKSEEIPNVAIQQIKPFVIVLYGLNDENWCERSLHSIFEQDYQNFRLIFIDDCSHDKTSQKVKDFILKYSQEHRSLLLQNEKRIGKTDSIQQAMSYVQKDEVVMPLNAHDWLTEPQILSYLNQMFQNRQTWVLSGKKIEYPSYNFVDVEDPICFYQFVFNKDLRSISSENKKHLKKIEKPVSFARAL